MLVFMLMVVLMAAVIGMVLRFVIVLMRMIRS